MRVIIQRVQRASVRVNGATVGAIERGLLLLVGFGQDDTEGKFAPIAEKIIQMRIFPNEQGRFDRSVLDINGGILSVPQFTLYADTSKGRRPEFFQALNPKDASRLFDAFTHHLQQLGISSVATGVFGAHMEVELVNDGPVTITVEL